MTITTDIQMKSVNIQIVVGWSSFVGNIANQCSLPVCTKTNIQRIHFIKSSRILRTENIPLCKADLL